MYEEHDEYEEARRLLAPLASEPTRPSMVDISRAVADGRRRVRTRRIAGVGAAATVTALVVAGVPAALAAVRPPEAPPASVAPTATPSPSPAPFPVPTASPEPAPEPPTRCELDLPPVPPGAAPSFAFGTDPTGRIVFGKYYRGMGSDAVSIQPVLWIDGEAVPLDVPGTDPNIWAVNSRGWAVGVSVAGDGESSGNVSWIYRDGEVTELPGEDVWARAITEDGVVVGTRDNRAVPVVWRSPDAPPEDLPMPPHLGDLITANVLSDGTVVGFRIGSSGLDRSFVWWPDGTVQELPPPKFDGVTVGFRAEFLNGHLVVGELWPDGSKSSSAVYDLATGEYTLLWQDAPIEIWSMNRHGWVAGVAEDGHAGLWTPEGGLVPLPDLGVPHEYSPNIPHSVSDDGRTITGVMEVDGRDRATVWRCD